MGSRSPRIAVGVAAVAAIVLIGACGQSGGDVDTAATAISIVPSGAIDVSLDPVVVPDSFPAGVPLPADVELAEAAELPGATTIYDITGWHPGTPVPLAEAYLAALDAAGFEVRSRSDSPDSVLFVVTGGDWFVSAGFYPDPVRNAGTSVGVAVGPAGSAPVSD